MKATLFALRLNELLDSAALESRCLCFVCLFPTRPCFFELLHSFRYLFFRIWQPHHHFFQMLESSSLIILGSKHCAQFLKVWIEFGEDVDWLARVHIHKHLPIYRAIIDERGSHLPVRCDHAKIGGVFAPQGIYYILCARGMELLCVPFPSLAHHLFTPKFI